MSIKYVMEGHTEHEFGLSTGQVICDRYTIVKKLGSGGAGVVYLAKDHQLENDYIALKFLYPHLSRDASVFQRFQNEVTISRKLSNPNIVSMYDIGHFKNNIYYISMEYVDGGSLADKIYAKKSTYLNFDDIIKIMIDLLKGISFAHANDVIHRDLKPENILFSKKGEAKIMDFGLAKYEKFENHLTVHGEALGTVFYMSPEQLRGEELDFRTDIYSLGIMAFEMAERLRPFSGDTPFDVAKKHFDRPLPEFQNKAIPKWFVELVRKCCSKKKEDRFQSCDELLTLLNNKVAQRDKTENYKKVSRKVRSAIVDKASSPTNLVAINMFLLILFIVLATSIKTKMPFHSIVRNIVFNERALNFEEATAAIRKSDITFIKKIIADDLNNQDSLGRTLLFLAVEENQPEIVNALLERKVNLDLANNKKITPLMIAVKYLDNKIFTDLLRKKININAIDINGKNAIHYAIDSQNLEAIKMLVAQGDIVHKLDAEGNSLLVYAIKNDDYLITKYFLELGLNVNKVNILGKTPVFYAVESKDTKITELLVISGAEVNIVDKAGNSPEVYAAPANVELLKKYKKNKKKLSK